MQNKNRISELVSINEADRTRKRRAVTAFDDAIADLVAARDILMRRLAKLREQQHELVDNHTENTAIDTPIGILCHSSDAMGCDIAGLQRDRTPVTERLEKDGEFKQAEYNIRLLPKLQKVLHELEKGNRIVYTPNRIGTDADIVNLLTEFREPSGYGCRGVLARSPDLVVESKQIRELRRCKCKIVFTYSSQRRETEEATEPLVFGLECVKLEDEDGKEWFNYLLLGSCCHVANKGIIEEHVRDYSQTAQVVSTNIDEYMNGFCVSYYAIQFYK